MSIYNSQEFLLDKKIYKKEVIEEAMVKYKNYCRISLKELDTNKFVVRISVEEGFIERNEYIKGELLNFLLGHSIGMGGT